MHESAAQIAAPESARLARRPLLPYKWELILLLWFAYFFNQADRQVYNVVLPALKTDLRLTDVQAGLVGSIFMGTYALLVPVAGYAGDVLRRAVCHDIWHFSARALISLAGQLRRSGHGRLTRSQPEP